MRIGIIGAGAAGLSAAEALRRKGYADITILEASDRAGGKCFSFQYEGRSYELGAGILSGNNRAALAIARRSGVAMERVEFGASVVLDPVTGAPVADASILDRLRLVKQTLLGYRRLCKQYARAAAPGLDHMDPALAQPFSIFAKAKGIELLECEFALYFTGYGYGFLDEIPAAYVLKYYSWELVRAYAKKQLYKFPDGIQGLWTRVAGEHDVHYETTITSIERGTTVRVTTSSGNYTFDRLIIAAPLDDALGYLDSDAEERALFSQIEYEDYRTYACIVHGLPHKNGYAPGNCVSSRRGWPVFWYQRYTDSDLYTFYVLGDGKILDADIERNLAAFVRPLGGTIERVLTTVHWKYFPHVCPSAFQDGYFDRLEALQGKRGTYYAGELLSFSSVGLTSEYAHALVERFFERALTVRAAGW